MEVKIGIQYAPRELILESTLSPEEVEAAVSAAIKSDLGLLSLTDDKGRKVLIPVSKIAYVDIAEAEGRRVGFGAGL